MEKQQTFVCLCGGCCCCEGLFNREASTEVATSMSEDEWEDEEGDIDCFAESIVWPLFRSFLIPLSSNDCDGLDDDGDGDNGDEVDSPSLCPSSVSCCCCCLIRSKGCLLRGSRMRPWVGRPIGWSSVPFFSLGEESLIDDWLAFFFLFDCLKERKIRWMSEHINDGKKREKKKRERTERGKRDGQRWTEMIRGREMIRQRVSDE